jgi:hypothetical protein
MNWVDGIAEQVREVEAVEAEVGERPSQYGPLTVVFYELEAAERSMGSVIDDGGERLTAVLHTRVIAETAIRLAWVKAPIQVRDRNALVNRLMRLNTLDVELLRRADDAIHKWAGFHMIRNREEMEPYLTPNSREFPAAPDRVDRMATEAQSPGLYGVFRYCSALSHPGFAQKKVDAAPDDMIWRFARYGYAGAALHAGAIFYGLGNLVEMPHMPINEHAYTQFGALPAQGGEDDGQPG